MSTFFFQLLSLILPMQPGNMFRSCCSDFRIVLLFACFGMIAPSAFGQFLGPKQLDFGHGDLQPPVYADLDGDGFKDLIIGNNGYSFDTYNAGGVLWKKNDGTGHFGAPQWIEQSGLFDSDLEAIDLDGNGSVDLAYNASTILILHFNDGQGHFSAPVPYNQQQISRLRFADLNGDGAPDRLECHPWQYSEKSFFKSLNDGAGQFAEPEALHLSDSCCIKLFELADLDGDGDLDLLTANDPQNDLFWRANDGSGNFGAAVFLATSPAPVSQLLLRDLDADGDRDVLVFSTFYEVPQLLWLSNQGAGVFNPDLQIIFEPSIGEHLSSAAVVAEDLTDDGAVDIAVMHEVSNDYDLLVFVNQNDGAGTMLSNTIAVSYLVPAFPLAADLDNDNLPEINLLSGNTVAQAHNAGAGVFEPWTISYSQLADPTELQIMDLNADGFPDLSYIGGMPDSLLNWRANDGTGHFGERRSILKTIDNNITGVFGQAFGDINNDGFDDVAFNVFIDGVSGTRWYQNDGDGHFSLADQIDGFLIHAHGLADLDSDGDLDMFGRQTFSADWDVMLNDGAGHFTPGSSTTLQHQEQFISDFADFDGDGFPDLVAANYNFEFYWYKNNGSGGFGPDHFITTSFGNLNLLAADPDQDNDLDIMLMGQSAGWLTNDGLGNFTDSVVVDAGFTYAMRTECVDMDNDGSLDLVVWPVANVGWSNAPQAMRFYRNLGNNQFAPAHAFGPAFPYSGVCIADLDNDGLNDIAFTSYGSLDWYKNATNTATIQGHCFVDDNGNGLWDANEAPLANIGILVEPEGEVNFSDSTGLFGFRFSSGSYTLSALPASCWNVTVAPAPPVVVLDTVVHGLLFGFQNFGNQLKISPYLSSEFPRCDTVVAFYLYASNPSCLPASGQLSLALDSLVNFVGAEPLPDVSTGNTLIWNLDTIAPWEGSAITLHLMNADASHVGDTIHLQAFTWVNDATGSLVLSDSVFYQAEIQCAYDPNDKQVDRATVPPDYWVSDRELIYTIRFQNTGNDTAFSVRLADTLNAALNWPTFRALNASHPYNLSLNLNSGLLQFEFNPIQLPDSTTNPQASQGFVQFAIELQPWLPAGTVVPNRAGIFFDANPVVLTNTAQTEVLDFVASHEPPAATGLTITPNPLTGPCTLHFDAPAPDGATVQLFDVGGRLLQNLNVQAGEMNQELNLGNLPSGWYRVQWNRPGQRPVSGRLVKI